MSTYLGTIPLPPKTLTEQEQSALLTVTGQRRGAFRDHMLFAIALGTGLREHEIVALDVGDIIDARGKVRQRVELRVFKRSSANPAPQVARLPESLRAKLAKWIQYKRRNGESIVPEAPLFMSRKGNRLSTRQMRHLFRIWQARAGFTHIYTFHALRHAGCSNIYRNTKDILVTRLFARHKDVRTTLRYAHPDEADLVRAIQGLRC